MALEYFKQLKESGESQKLGGQFNTALPLAIWALEQAINKTSEDTMKNQGKNKGKKNKE